MVSHCYSSASDGFVCFAVSLHLNANVELTPLRAEYRSERINELTQIGGSHFKYLLIHIIRLWKANPISMKMYICELI